MNLLKILIKLNIKYNNYCKGINNNNFILTNFEETKIAIVMIKSRKNYHQIKD